MAEAATAVQLEKSWPEESPYKKGFCAASRQYDTRWADLLKSARLNAWTKATMQECHYEVRLEEARHRCARICQEKTHAEKFTFQSGADTEHRLHQQGRFSNPTDMARPTKRNHQQRRRRCNPPGTACERVVLDRTKTFSKCKYQGESQWVGAFLVRTRRYRYQHHVFRRKREGWRQQQVRAARHTSRQRSTSSRSRGGCSAFCRSSERGEETKIF